MIESKQQYRVMLLGLGFEEAVDLDNLIEALREVARVALLVDKGKYPGAQLHDALAALPDWITEE